MDGNQFAHSLSGCSAGIGSSLNCSYIAANHYGYITAADSFLSY